MSMFNGLDQSPAEAELTPKMPLAERRVTAAIKVVVRKRACEGRLKTYHHHPPSLHPP
jgi:hypothetical protein